VQLPGERAGILVTAGLTEKLMVCAGR